MSGCSIRGRVATVLGEPVRKAEITFTSTDFVKRVEYVTATDEAGGFRLDDIDPGQYHLAARKTGYVRAVYGFPTPLTIAPGRAVPDLEMTLAPQAVITGRVFDPDGDP